MGLSGPKTNANTTNNSNSTTTIGSVGVTGADATAIIADLSGSLRRVSDNATITAENQLRFGSDTIENANNTLKYTANIAAQTLADTINAARDSNQRTIAAGLNQAAPITELDSANAGKSNNMLLYIAIGLAILAFLS